MKIWDNFWRNVKKKLDEVDYEEKKQIPQKIQDWTEIHNFNPLAIVNNKLTSLVCDDATFDVESDSDLAEPLKELVKELEAKRYVICSMMNGKGGCYVTMANGVNGKPYHVVLPPTDVSVYKMSNNKIYEIAMVIDKKKVKHRKYELVRHHILDENGTLSVIYYVTDESGAETYLAEWADYADKGVAYLNANHIGVAYFKSPQDSRGLEPVEGVPLNFGCEEAEREIIQDREALATEMKLAKMKLFAHKNITRVNRVKNADLYSVDEDIYVTQGIDGMGTGSLLEEFAPQTRFADYAAKLEKSYEDYENQIGLNKGFLSKPETTNAATATEILTANVKTISFIKKEQAAMYEGIKQALTADSVFLNIPLDWSIVVDWFDAFEDYDKQYERLANAVDRGIAEKADEMRWLFPTLTAEEIEEKLARIDANKSINEDEALERMLMGEV